MTVSFPVKRMVEESLTGGQYRGSTMPTCRLCGSTYPREFFIHGNGPNAQVCVRCGVDHGLVTKEDVPVLFEKSAASARFSAVARRYSVFLYLPFLWILWGSTLSGVEPWGLFFLILLILLTLIAPVLFIYRGGQYSGDMARLTPSYDRPKGH